MEGERGGIDTEAEQELFECFPGTGYSILLPVIALNTQLMNIRK